MFSVPTMGAFMSLTEPNSAAAILQFAIEIMPPPIPPAGATRDETPAGRRLLSFDTLFSCAVPDDRSKNVAGTWIRFMTRLATEMGMVLAFPKRRPSTETPIKRTAGPEIVSASEKAVIRSRQVIECRKSRTAMIAMSSRYACVPI